MAITSTDIKYKYSTKSGSAGNTTAGNATSSLGKYISITEVSASPLNNLFDDVSGSENAASDVEYRCIFVHNDHGTLTLENSVVWMSAEVAGGADVAIGLDPAGVTPKGQAAAQAAEVVNEDTAPAGVTFSSPTTEGAALSIGNIAPGSVQAIWIRRTANNTTAVSNDGATIRVKGDTQA